MRKRTWLLGTLLLPVTLAAQGERITLRIVPAPNQVIRVGMTQQMLFDISAESLPGGTAKMEGQMAMQGTERVGARDPQGRLSAQLTYDQVSMDMSMNGSPLPTGAPSNPLAGKAITFVYDGEGKVVDVNVPEELGPAANTVKQMLSSITGNLPNATLGIGDTITVPNNMTLPIALPGETGATTTMSGTTTFKLVAIGRDGSDRLATLEQRMEATIAGTMRLTGTGTMLWNVDKCFVRSGASDMSLDMTMTMPGMGGTMQIKGTIHMVITGTSQPR